MAPSSPPAVRRRTSPQSSSPGSPEATSQSRSSELKSIAADLPPPRQTRSMRRVSPVLANTRLNRLVYLLVLLAALMGAWYAYRVVQYKREVGGWWDVALGRGSKGMRGASHGVQEGTRSGAQPPRYSQGCGAWWKGKHHQRDTPAPELTVEDHLTALSRLLGVPSAPLAAAIAGAVRAYVPPASLSSLASNPRETRDAVKILLGEGVRMDGGSGVHAVRKGEELRNQGEGEAGMGEEGGLGIVDGVVHGVGSFVGMDEP